MKLKYDRISLENLLKLTDRYLYHDSIYTNLCTDNLPEFSNTVLELIKKMPIIIFIKNDIYLDKSSLFDSETFKDIFIPMSLEIEYILNIEHLVILMNFYKRKKEFQDLSIPVLFVNIDTSDMNYNLLSELDILTTLKLFTNKNHNTINTKLLKNMFIDDASLLKHKIQKTLVEYLFPVNRKKSIEKVDPVDNPWNYLYLQSNSKYLHLADAKKKFQKNY